MPRRPVSRHSCQLNHVMSTTGFTCKAQQDFSHTDTAESGQWLVSLVHGW